MIITEKLLQKIKAALEKNFENIVKLTDESDDNFNKNILWFTFLESIGNIYYSKEQNGVRFRRTIKELCKYKNYNRIISPLFYLFLKSQKRQDNDQKLMSELEAFSWGDIIKDRNAASRIIKAAQLPSLDEISKKTSIDRKTLTHFQLDNLLWVNRNMGIHARWQADFPTGSTFNDISIVCYLNTEGNQGWRMYITADFLQSLASEALHNISTQEGIEYIYNETDELRKILSDNFFYTLEDQNRKW